MAQHSAVASLVSSLQNYSNEGEQISSNLIRCTVTEHHQPGILNMADSLAEAACCAVEVLHGPNELELLEAASACWVKDHKTVQVAQLISVEPPVIGDMACPQIITLSLAILCIHNVVNNG